MQHKLLFVSFDGFRWNYDRDVDTPNLDSMAQEGVKAQYMTPAFITLTSPCHFTLVTGKYIENHGVVHNMFYNTTTTVRLPYHTTLGIQRWWDNGSIPIWITAQRQGLKTGSFFYPGGNVTYQGEAVTMSRKEGFLHNYKNETEWRQNVDTVMRWFTEEDASLVTLYFGEPDSTGHRYGPESQERKDMVKQVDRTVGYIRDSIKRHHLTDSLNLIITSDHGMTTVQKNASDLVEFHKFPNFTFNDIAFQLLDYGPNGMLIPKEGMLEKVYNVLKDAHPRLHVYKKEDFPKSFHYANHSRITPLLMYSDLGYVIHGRVNVQFNNGEHGFDNQDMDMKTIFRAVGPSFKAGLEVEPFESVHVYELMCQLLGIVPEPNDGHPDVLRPMLRSGSALRLSSQHHLVTLLMGVLDVSDQGRLMPHHLIQFRGPEGREGSKGEPGTLLPASRLDVPSPQGPSKILTLSLPHTTHSQFQHRSHNTASGFYQAGNSNRPGNQRSTPEGPSSTGLEDTSADHQIPATITLPLPQMPPCLLPRATYSFLPISSCADLKLNWFEENCKASWFWNAPGASLALRTSQHD
ncbi:Ectonucleotide pyrophosphatase/phosphodiesterase family member 7 [Apodemus speciosus]|uniref:Ectonucleotide pyrophosphatase/phosphodiesterase family member 7 n=1 Tax=Apodemus speciosus TaxID=105296 RepID=A0ABQ0FCZ7_APOSI